MKISVIIPTRSRASYLRAALQSAFVAADRAGCPVEIVVSDNASDDDTSDVVAEFADPRLISRRTSARFSMRQNFEFALSHSTGSHIVFCGDDDAVLPNGLRILSRLIAADDPDIVKWRVLNYLWPDPATGIPGTLKVRPQRLDGRLRKIQPRAVLERFAQADFTTYREGGMIYHGCVSRRLIDRAVAATGGPYFRGSSPDVFTSMQALMVTDRPMLRINLPITLGGASPRSNGAAAQTAAVAGHSVAGSEYGQFIAESERDPYQCRLPANCQSLDMVQLDCLQTAAALHGSDVQIDLEAWQQRIAADIAGFAEPARGASLDLAREVFGMEIALPPLSNGSHHGPVPEVPKPETVDTAAGGRTTARMRHRLTSLSYAGGAAMADVAAAAGLLDHLLDLDGFEQPGTGLLPAVLRILRQHTRAGKLAG